MQWRHVPPDRFEYTERLPLAAAVIGMAVAAVAACILGHALLRPADLPEPLGSLRHSPKAITMLIVFMVVGLAMAFYRWGFRVDLGTQSLTRWWVFLAPVGRRRYSLAQFGRVGVLWLPPGNPDDSLQSHFWVTLAGSGKPLRLTLLPDLRDARALARDLAEFLRLPVHDETLGRIEL